MGDRRNVKLMYGDNQPPVYFYTHWHGEDLPRIVADALDSQSGRSRWGDPDYLARIIFSAMIRYEIDDASGYGIAPYRMDYNHEDIEIDLINKTADGRPYEVYIEYNKSNAAAV
mgnify:FL=1